MMIGTVKGRENGVLCITSVVYVEVERSIGRKKVYW